MSQCNFIFIESLLKTVTYIGTLKMLVRKWGVRNLPWEAGLWFCGLGWLVVAGRPV